MFYPNPVDGMRTLYIYIYIVLAVEARVLKDIREEEIEEGNVGLSASRCFDRHPHEATG